MAKETDVGRDGIDDRLGLARLATVSAIGLMFVPSDVLKPICRFLGCSILLAVNPVSLWFLSVTTGYILGPLAAQAISSGLVGAGCGFWWMWEEETRALRRFKLFECGHN